MQAGARRGDEGPHHHRHRAPAVDRGQRRPDRRAGARPAGRGRHAPAAARRSARRLCAVPSACRATKGLGLVDDTKAIGADATQATRDGAGRSSSHERHGPGRGRRRRPHGPDADPHHPRHCRRARCRRDRARGLAASRQGCRRDSPASARIGVAITDDPLPAFAKADGVLDFTTPAATVEFAGYAAQARIVHVIGTTGCSAGRRRQDRRGGAACADRQVAAI